jgi:hypothetical protein
MIVQMREHVHGTLIFVALQRASSCDAKKVFALARELHRFPHDEHRGKRCAASESCTSACVNLARRISDDSALTVSGATAYKTATERGGAGANGPERRALGKLLHFEVCINNRSVVDC